MKTIAQKTKSKLILTSDLIFGIICIALVVAFAVLFAKAGGFDALSGSESTQVIVLCVFFVVFLLGGIWMIGRFVYKCLLPDVLLEADETNLYVRTLRNGIQRVIPLADLLESEVIGAPESFLAFLIQGSYGTLTISHISGGQKNVRLRFVDAVPDVPSILLGVINDYRAKNGL